MSTSSITLNRVSPVVSGTATVPIQDLRERQNLLQPILLNCSWFATSDVSSAMIENHWTFRISSISFLRRLLATIDICSFKISGEKYFFSEIQCSSAGTSFNLSFSNSLQDFLRHLYGHAPQDPGEEEKSSSLVACANTFFGFLAPLSAAWTIVEILVAGFDRLCT